MNEMTAPEDETQDTLFGGALRLRQPRKGHRAGTDGVLLAAMTPPDARRIADMGASTGLVGLRAAQLNQEARVMLIEQAAHLLALARLNIHENGLRARVEACEADVFALGKNRDLRETFDAVLSNPPYFEAAHVRPSGNEERAKAHVFPAQSAGLEGWIRAAATLTAPRGACIFIYHAQALGSLLPAFLRRFGEVRLVPVHAKENEAAIRVLISGIKGSRAPLRLCPPLILHGGDGRFTPLAARLHAGEVRLPYSGI
jgi:tRNA1(Val) A37 N6-methylase TrmN6